VSQVIPTLPTLLRKRWIATFKTSTFHIAHVISYKCLKHCAAQDISKSGTIIQPLLPVVLC